jgi:hypothetical protein
MCDDGRQARRVVAGHLGAAIAGDRRCAICAGSIAEWTVNGTAGAVASSLCAPPARRVAEVVAERA